LNQQSPTSLQKGIWIASYPKSGHTWVRVFIHNLLREIRGKKNDSQDINRLSRHTVWEIDAAPYEQLLGKPVVECTAEEIARTRPQVQQLLSEARSRPFFIKTHLGVARIRGFPTINLEMTLAAVYIVRNPLDVAISYAHHGNREVDHVIEQMADPALQIFGPDEHFYEFVGSWSGHVAGWLSISRRPVHLVRYEDMLRAPVRIFGGLARFLRLNPTPEQLQRAIDKSSFAELSRQEQQNSFAEKPPGAEKFFRVGKADQWRDVLTREQVRRVVEAHAPMMQRTGYLIPDCGGDVRPASRSTSAAQGTLAMTRRNAPSVAVDG